MPKIAKPIDAQVGARVRMHRRMLSLTQGDLAAALGITFQQVQKYEKGTNRIGAGRLQEIANILRVPVGTFFEETTAGTAGRDGFSDAELTNFVSSGEGLALARSFVRINDSKLRRRVVKLVEELSNATTDSGADQHAFNVRDTATAGRSDSDRA
jgi:transcriptional regulator with XRE-family HTH domain